MAIGLTNDTFNESPYITVTEYKNAPTSIDYNNLVVGGNEAAQDAELANVILRASSYMNEYFNQSLVADTITETKRTRVTPQGWISLHPKNSNLVALTDFEYGANPNNLTVLPDCSQAWFEEQQLVIPLYQSTMSSQGPLSFGFPMSNRNIIFCKYTYIAGFPVTTSSGVAGESSITVADATGILPGQRLRISDGAKSEQVTVDSTYVFGDTTVPVAAPLGRSHTNAATDALPAVVKEACILLTTAFIKIRGDQSLTMMATTRPSGAMMGSELYGSEIKLALDMVDKFRRVR